MYVSVQKLNQNYKNFMSGKRLPKCNFFLLKLAVVKADDVATREGRGDDQSSYDERRIATQKKLFCVFK